MTNTSQNKLIIICFSLIVLIILFIIITNKTTHVVTHKANNPEHFTTSDGTQINYLISPAKHAKGTLLWLHGDGAAEFYEPDTKYYLEGPHGIKQTAAAHQLTFIVPKTLSKDETWWTNGEQFIHFNMDFSFISFISCLSTICLMFVPTAAPKIATVKPNNPDVSISFNL